MRGDSVVIVLFLFVMLLSVSAFAAQPSDIVQQSTSGLIIEYPKQDYFPQGQTSKLQFHVYNSTGHYALNATTVCTIHLYNTSGDRIAFANLSYGSSGFDYFYTLTNAITGVASEYFYSVACTDSNQAGFLSTSFLITERGGTSLDQGIVFLLGFVMLVLGGMAAIFMSQKHPLTYMFTFATFIVADVMAFIAYRVAMLNLYTFAMPIFRLYQAMIVITFILAIVTMLDITRMVIQMNQKKKAANEITRFGYA